MNQAQVRQTSVPQSVKVAQSAKKRQLNVRPIHRIIGSVIMLFVLYFAVTGTSIQLVDLHAILTHAPATNPEMIQIREGTNGPTNYVVIQPTDYAAAPLPPNFDFHAALATVLRAVHDTAGDQPLHFVELRSVGDKAVGLVRTSDKTLSFDATSGQPLASPGRRRPARVPGATANRGPSAAAGAAPAASAPAAVGQPFSWHAAIKAWHRLMVIGNWFAIFNAIIGIGLFVMIVTGLVLYFRLLRARSRAGLKGFFWVSGGLWRSLHRWVSVVAAIFLLIVSVTGTLLAIDAFGLGLYQVTHKNAGKYARFPPGAVDDFSSPLPEDKLPAMLDTTLAAGRGTPGATPIKVVRLRYFNGIPQGVLIAGTGNNTSQLVFNSETGKRMSITEPGYPKTHYHLGWRYHEIVKEIHRGDFFGLPGRFMDLFAGLSVIYLSISGGVMYFDLWRKRRRGGRAEMFWT